MQKRPTQLLLGISGSIAAYKAADLCRRLQDRGYDIYAALSDGARHFVTDELFEALTHHPIPADLHSDPLWHTEVGRAVDLCVVAPASASFLAKLAAGIADDLLLATLLVSKAPKLLVPAMNEGMWQNPITRRNVQQLKDLGYLFLEPDNGWLACGIEGEGRFPEANRIVDFVNSLSLPNSDVAHQAPINVLQGKRMVLTLGPTREAIDPVRYISNRSSGKIGLALAAACARRGVNLQVIGSAELVAAAERFPNVTGVAIESARDMEKAVWEAVRLPVDVLWMTAAVADYRAKQVSPVKLRRSTDVPSLQAVEWEATPDILQGIARPGPQRPKVVVGFCLVDQDLSAQTQAKRQRKNADVMIGNTPDNLGGDTASVLWCDTNTSVEISGSKADVAVQLLDTVANNFFTT